MLLVEVASSSSGDAEEYRMQWRWRWRWRWRVGDIEGGELTTHAVQKELRARQERQGRAMRRYGGVNIVGRVGKVCGEGAKAGTRVATRSALPLPPH